MTKQLAWSWEHVFSTRLPEHLDLLAEALQNVLRSFRKRMAKRPQLKKAPSFALATRQVRNLERSFKDTTEFKAMVSVGQKEASRLIVPTIAEAMAGAYTYCVGESGKNNRRPPRMDMDIDPFFFRCWLFQAHESARG